MLQFIKKIKNLYYSLTGRRASHLKEIWGWIKLVIKEKSTVNEEFLNDYREYRKLQEESERRVKLEKREECEKLGGNEKMRNIKIEKSEKDEKKEKSKKNDDEEKNDDKEYKDFCDGLIKENNLRDLKHLKVFIRDIIDKNQKNYKNVERLKYLLTSGNLNN